MSEWQLIETAPMDGTRILVAGKWNERSAVGEGKPYCCVGAWSTFMSNGTGYQWIYEGAIGAIDGDHIAVTFTHWMPLPAP